MNAKIQAFCAAFRELQREGGLQKSDIYRIASRYGVDQEELAKALLSADSFVAAEILDVNADHLNEALEHYGIGLDPDAVNPLVVQKGESDDLRSVPHDFLVTGSCDLCHWSRNYRCYRADWDFAMLINTISRDHGSESEECDASDDLLKLKVNEETVAPIPTADLPPIERSFANALQAVMQEWPVDPDEREDAFRRVAGLGAVKAVKSAINETSEGKEFVSLWGFDRLDLTFEALALCPAWADLFSDEEKKVALKRLDTARSVWERSEYRNVKAFRDPRTLWIGQRPIGASSSRYFLATASTICEMFATISNVFEKTGRFAASLSDRRHYLSCTTCGALPSLREVIAVVDSEELRQLRILLSTMPVLIQRPLCWETVTALAFIDRNCDVDPADWVSGRQGKSDRAFSDFVQSLDTFEFFGLLLAKRVGKMFGPPALSLHGELLLPSDLGFSPERGVLDTSLSADDWNRFREIEDGDAFAARPGASIFDDPQTNFRDLMHLALDATNFEVRTLWEGSEPEYLVRTDLQPSLNQRFERNDPNRVAAASLRNALGGRICDGLCLEAYMAAIEAERLCLSGNHLKSGNSTVSSLVRAFECQFDHFLLEPLRKLLIKDMQETQRSPAERKLASETKNFTLGEKAQLVYYPSSQFRDICMHLGVDLTRLARILPEVIRVRNEVFHSNKEYTSAEAQDIRNRWFGVPGGDGGIFAIVTGAKP